MPISKNFKYRIFVRKSEKQKMKMEFCRIFPIRPRRNVQGIRRLPRRLPHRVPAVCIFAESVPYRASQS